MAQRAADRRRQLGSMERGVRARPPLLRRALLERLARMSPRCRRSGSPRRGRRSSVPAEPDLRRRWSALGAGRGRARRAHRRGRGAAPPDPPRPALARARRARLPGALRGRRAGARRRLPPGHGVAVADGSVRRGVGARPRGLGGGEARGARAVHRALAPAPRPGGDRPCLRDRRRRPASHAAGLPVPGLVAGSSCAWSIGCWRVWGRPRSRRAKRDREPSSWRRCRKTRDRGRPHGAPPARSRKATATCSSACCSRTGSRSSRRCRRTYRLPTGSSPSPRWYGRRRPGP